MPGGSPGGSVNPQDEDHEKPRQDSREKQLVHVHLGHQAVQDQGNGRGKQQADAAGNGHEPKGKVRAVTFLEHQRVKQASQGDDGDPRGSRKRGKKSTSHEDHQGDASRNPSQESLGQPGQALRGFAVRQDEAGKREQGNGDQGRGAGDPVEFDEQRSRVDAGLLKRQPGGQADDGEQRGAEKGENQKSGDEKIGHGSVGPGGKKRFKALMKNRRAMIRKL